MGANIELWQYKIYENGIFQLEELHSKTGSGMVENTGIKDGKNPVMVEAGKNAVLDILEHANLSW